MKQASMSKPMCKQTSYGEWVHYSETGWKYCTCGKVELAKRQGYAW